MKVLHFAIIAVTSLLLSASLSWAQCGMGGHGSHQGHQSHDEDAVQSTDAKPISTYPLTYCLVSGEPLGSMGDPVIRTYNSRQIKFCCGGCVSKFEANQEGYLKQLDNTIIANQRDTYPLNKCVVTGETLGKMGEPYDYVYDNELVRFCCAGCVSKFEKDPEKYLTKLDKAAGTGDEKRGGNSHPSSAASPSHSAHQH